MKPSSTAMLWITGVLGHGLIALGALLVLLSPAASIYLNCDYFRAGLLRYALLSAVCCPVFALMHAWWPKFFGWPLDARLGKVHFWGTMICFNIMALPLLVMGLRLGESAGWLKELPKLGVYGLLFYQLPLVWAAVLQWVGQRDSCSDDAPASAFPDRPMQHQDQL